MAIDTGPTPATAHTTRRALIVGALGAGAASIAAALGRPSPARASVDGDVVLGVTNVATSTTEITNTTNSFDVLHCTSSGSGYGVFGSSSSSVGVAGYSDSHTGVLAHSTSSTGVDAGSNLHVAVQGVSFASDQPAILGQSKGNFTGVQGYSGTGTPPAAKPKTGVYGYAAQDASSHGVTGQTATGIGVFGIATTGYAGYFSGKVHTTAWYEMSEISTPAAPAANRARLFVRDNGSGKTQLCVRFATGAVQVIATQP